VLGARSFYHLPYFNANIDLEQHINNIDYALKRSDRPAAYFNGSWNIGETIPFSHPDSLEFFLTERYCLYAENDDELYRARIFHPPWPLQKATMNSYDSTMIEALGLKSRKGAPVLNYCEKVEVEIWPIHRV